MFGGSVLFLTVQQSFPASLLVTHLVFRPSFLKANPERGFGYKLRGLPWRFSSEESAFKAGDTGSIPGWGRSPRGGRGSVLAWRIPWREGPGGYIVHRIAESDMTEATEDAHTSC